MIREERGSPTLRNCIGLDQSSGQPGGECIKIRRKLDHGIEKYPVLDVERNSTCLFGQLACLADPTRDPRSHGLDIAGHADRVVLCAGVSARGSGTLVRHESSSSARAAGSLHGGGGEGGDEAAGVHRATLTPQSK